MAFPSVVARATGRTTASNTTTHPITLPTHSAGQLLLVVFGVDGTPTITATAGWTQLGQNSYTTLTTGAVFYKIAASAAETLTLTTSTSEQSSHVSLAIAVATSGYLLTVEGSLAASGSSANPDPPAFTPTIGAADKINVALAVNRQVDYATAAPTNYTNLTVQAAAGSGGASTATAERGNVNWADQDPSAFTITTARAWVAGTLCVYEYEPPVFPWDDDSGQWDSDSSAWDTVQYTVTTSANGVLQKGQTRTTAANAIKQKAYSLTASANAVKQKAYAKTVSAGAVLQESFTKTAVASAILRETFTKTVDANAVLERAPVEVKVSWIELDVQNGAAVEQYLSTTASAVLQAAGLTKTASADAELQKAFAATAAADAAIQKEQAAVADASAILQKTQTVTAGATGWLTGTVRLTASASADLTEVQSNNWDDDFDPWDGDSTPWDGIRYTQFAYADAELQKEFSQTATASAILQKQGIVTASASGQLSGTVRQTAEADAQLQKAFSVATTANAVLQALASGTRLTYANAVLARLDNQITVSANAVLAITGGTRTTTANALLQKAFSKTASANAIKAKLDNLRTASASAIIISGGAGTTLSAEADALLSKNSLTIVGADAIIISDRWTVGSGVSATGWTSDSVVTDPWAHDGAISSTWETT